MLFPIYKRVDKIHIDGRVSIPNLANSGLQ